MIKPLRYILLLTALSGASCKKFLDVKPEDKYTDDQVFASRVTIEQTLNGLYEGLTDDDLYGGELTVNAIELIATRYNKTSVLYTDMLALYGKQGPPGSTFDAIWSKAYALVLRTNNFIGLLDNTRGKGIVTDAQADLLKGEAVGLRAFIQFDMLRLYGPLTVDSSVQAVPYYTIADGKARPLLSFGQSIGRVLEDLAAAEQLLSKDPIKSKGVITTGDVDFFNSFRNRRFNYYAVKALEARVDLYAGYSVKAHAAAKEVVDAADAIFPWTDYTAIVNNANPDRVFSSEVIFGMDNRGLYALQNKYFSPSLNPQQILSPSNDQLDAAFEYNENDYRYVLSSWQNSTWGFRTFFKYADLADQSKSWRYFQPLIRKSEMYYILAETDPDAATAVAYLNTVRFNRGLPDLPDDAQLTDFGGEIEKEYIKEFYGEGQLFFFYKRLGAWWAFDIPTYLIPLPISETSLRQ